MGFEKSHSCSCCGGSLYLKSTFLGRGEAFLSVLYNFDIFLQIVRREGLSLWQELWPSIITLSNMGPIQVRCIISHALLWFSLFTVTQKLCPSLHVLGKLGRCDVLQRHFPSALGVLSDLGCLFVYSPVSQIQWYKVVKKSILCGFHLQSAHALFLSNLRGFISKRVKVFGVTVQLWWPLWLERNSRILENCESLEIMWNRVKYRVAWYFKVMFMSI